MSASILTADRIRQIEWPLRGAPRPFHETMRELARIRGAVENHWGELRSEVRGSLVDLAYDGLEHEAEWVALRPFAYRGPLLQAGPGGEQRDIAPYLVAMQELKEAVLSAVERQHPAYRQKMAKLAQGLDALLDDAASRPPMTLAEFDEWLGAPAATTH